MFSFFSSSQRHVQGAMEEIKRKGKEQQESGQGGHYQISKPINVGLAKGRGHQLIPRRPQGRQEQKGFALCKFHYN
jgi:hypothetical protein